MAHHPIGFISPETRLHQKSRLLSYSKPSYLSRALYPAEIEGRGVSSEPEPELFCDLGLQKVSCSQAEEGKTGADLQPG